MGLFGPRRVPCPAGVWTDIISTAFVGLPASWEVDFASRTGGGVDGEFVQKRTFWIFPQAPEQGILQGRMMFHRRYINTFYRVSVKPATDLVADIRRTE